MSTTYVKFVDSSNNSTLVGGGTNGWTPVDSGTFDQSLATGFAAAQTDNSGPPTFSLPLADSGVAVQVEAAAAAGDAFQTEVATYDDAGRLTSDYLLTVSTVGADQDTLGQGDNLVHTLALRAGAYTSKTTTYDGSGNPTTTTGGYSFIRNAPISMPAPSAPSTSSSLQANADVDAHSYGTLDTFVALGKIDGTYIRSSSQVATNSSEHLPASGKDLSAYKGDLFEADDFVSSSSYGGTTQGNAISLSYSSAADPSSPVLFDMLASATPLKNVEIVQVGSPDFMSGALVVSDTLYNNVTVVGETYQLGDGGANARIYQFQVGAGPYIAGHDNTSSKPTTGSFSVKAPTTIAAGAQATAEVPGGGVTYQMTVGSGAGATTATISSAQFSVQRSGANTTYSPLTVTFDSMPSDTTLAAFALPTSQVSIDQMKGAGGSSTNQVTYDTLTFRTIYTSQTPTMTDNGDGTTSYTYTYNISAFQESYRDPPSTPHAQSGQSRTWNQVRNSDGSTGLQATCFVTGTLIRTVRAGREQDVAVERLDVGDLVVTGSGEHRQIKWIGHRDVECHRHQDLRPVRIAAHAFGEGKPARDLHLSPGHPVLVDADADGAGGHLVPIMCLINGTSVRRVAVRGVTYWHVELHAHDILLAEGLRAESYIDLGSRAWFAGAEGALYDPDLALPGMPGRCRPVAVDGPVVEAERRRLDMVFATRLAWPCAWPVEGGLSVF